MSTPCYDAVMPKTSIEKITGKKYRGPNINGQKKQDLTAIENQIKVNDVRAMIHDSQLAQLVLAMATTGLDCKLDEKLLKEGKSWAECVIFGDELKEGTRQKYISVLMDKIIPNEKDTKDSESEDRHSRYLQAQAEHEADSSPLDLEFDAAYKPHTLDGADPAGETMADPVNGA